MTRIVTTNKQGQVLGQKGSATRQRFLDATRQLLKTKSPIELTAVEIAKQAKISSGSFYMYFDDVKDIMYALSQAAVADMADLYSVLDEPWDASKVEVAHTRRLVKAYFAVWERHREILRYRNLEADRGDTRFEQLRVEYYTPFIEKLGERILSAYPVGNRPRRGDAYAEATVIHAALEGIAATDPQVVERALGAKRMQDALARVIAHILGGRAQDDTWYDKNGQSGPGPSQPTRKARAKKQTEKQATGPTASR